MQSHVAAHGMAVAPHHLASQSALAVLREGGSAIEAMVAAAATIAVVYPHMNGLGGDGFWLIVPTGGDTRAQPTATATITSSAGRSVTRATAAGPGRFAGVWSSGIAVSHGNNRADRETG